MLNKKSILITGGTGTFGQAFVKFIIKKFKIKRLVIFSRDEFKQYEMSKVFLLPNIHLLDILLVMLEIKIATKLLKI